MGLNGIASNHYVVTTMVLMATTSTTWYCNGVDGRSSGGGLEWGSKKCDRGGPQATSIHHLPATAESRNNMFSL